MTKNIKIKKISQALMIVGLAVTAPTAANATGNYMTTGSITTQPIGHAYFCQQFPKKCQVKSRKITAPKLTKARWKQLLHVNASANAAIEPVTDQDLYGVEEHWTYPQQYGDCEDYALLKRHMLLQQGWPESSLLMTVVKQSNGEGHAVLTVRTQSGDFILDNLETRINRWSEAPYKFLKRQNPKHLGKWQTIKDYRETVVAF